MFILTKENRVEIEPRMLFIPEFKKIFERDRSKTKSKSQKEFAFIYFMADYKSEYNIYGIEKPVAVKRDIMGNEDYEPDEDILSAIEKYEMLQETTSMRYLKSVRETVNSLMKFYNELRYKSNSTNVTDYDPGPVTKALKDVELIVEKIEKWEKKVRSEEDSMSIRGGGELNIFEEKETATWMKTN